MKKYIKYIFVIFTMFFCFNSGVKAAPMRVCNYKARSVLGLSEYTYSILISDQGIKAYKTSEEFTGEVFGQKIDLSIFDKYADPMEVTFGIEEFMPDWNNPTAQCPSKIKTDGLFDDRVSLTSGSDASLDPTSSTFYQDADSIIVPNPDDEIKYEDPPGGKPSIFDGSCPENLGIVSLLNKFYSLIKIAVPISLVIFGMIDFAKAVFASDESKMKKAQSAFIRRLIGAVSVFLIMALLTLISNTMIPKETGILECVKKILE